MCVCVCVREREKNFVLTQHIDKQSGLKRKTAVQKSIVKSVLFDALYVQLDNIKDNCYCHHGPPKVFQFFSIFLTQLLVN